MCVTKYYHLSCLYITLLWYLHENDTISNIYFISYSLNVSKCFLLYKIFSHDKKLQICALFSYFLFMMEILQPMNSSDEMKIDEGFLN